MNIPSASSFEHFSVNDNPIPPYGLYDFEDTFTKLCINQNLEQEINKIESFIKENQSFSAAGKAYILCLRNKIAQNKYMLQKKLDTDPRFSAITCVRLCDLKGLEILVANSCDVNQQDNRLRSAIHFAAADTDKIDYLKTLLLHPNIDLTLRTTRGNLAKDLVKTSEFKDLFLS
jgi:hypothetical protein